MGPLGEHGGDHGQADAHEDRFLIFQHPGGHAGREFGGGVLFYSLFYLLPFFLSHEAFVDSSKISTRSR